MEILLNITLGEWLTIRVLIQRFCLWSEKNISVCHGNQFSFQYVTGTDFYFSMSLGRFLFQYVTGTNSHFSMSWEPILIQYVMGTNSHFSMSHEPILISVCHKNLIPICHRDQFFLYFTGTNSYFIMSQEPICFLYMSHKPTLQLVCHRH